MTNSIGDLLSKSRFQEPPEIAVIKKFVQEKYQVTPSVTVKEKQIMIGVQSAALAGALRMNLWELAQLCGTTKRLVIRIEQRS